MKYKDLTIYQVPEEIENIRNLVRQTKDVIGDIAEVGVFEGATALVIREESDKELWLFDTFEGFPNTLDDSDSKSYFVGDCKASDEMIRELLKDDKKAHIVKGIFPETGDVIKDKEFSFVHIDVDIYKSMKESLEFFIPKMNKGGVILIHDYPVHRGVKKAVDELKLQPEIIGTFGRQAIIRL